MNESDWVWVVDGHRAYPLTKAAAAEDPARFRVTEESPFDRDGRLRPTEYTEADKADPAAATSVSGPFSFEPEEA